MKQIILTESQLNQIILTESIFNIRDKEKLAKYLISLLYAGTLTINAALGYVDKTPSLSPQDKQEVVQQIQSVANDTISQPKPIDDISPKSHQVSTKNQYTAKPNEMNAENHWVLADNNTIVTVYNAVANQCNKDTQHTASGFKLDLKNVGKHKVCAVERTFMKQLGLNYGDLIKIEGTANGAQDGVYRVEDTMNKRFAGQHKVDILVPNNVKLGGTRPTEKAKLYVLKDNKYKQLYTKKMKPSMSNKRFG